MTAELTPDALAELWRLAEAATPGPWYGADELSLLIENERATEDIPYIAAANPAVVLDLLDQLDAAEARLAAVRDIVRDVATDAGDDRGTYGETYHAGMVTVAARIRQALAIDAPTIDGRADA